MPYGRHRVKGTQSFRVGKGRGYPTRYRFHGTVLHRGKRVLQRLGFRNNKVVEVSYLPYHKRKR